MTEEDVHSAQACFDRVYETARSRRVLILDWPPNLTLACLNGEHGCCRHDWCKCECHGA